MAHTRLGVVLLCSSALLIALAGGCGDARRRDTVRYHDNVPPPADPLVYEASDTGTHGGRFVVAGLAAPKTFNPVTADTVPSNDINRQLFVALTSFDGVSQVDSPGLAKSWEVAPDGIKWTFHLRTGARFSDGHPITADDVVFSFAAIYDPTVAALSRTALTTKGRAWVVTATDPYTVVIDPLAPNGSLVSLVSLVRIVPRHILEPRLRDGTFNSSYGVMTAPDRLVVSGPWRLKQYEPGARTVLTRNPYWFGVDAQHRRLPYLDEVVFVVVPDQDAADLKFRAGEVDALSTVKPENYRWYEDNQTVGRYTLHTLGAQIGPSFLFFNLNRATTPASGQPIGTPSVGVEKFAWFGSAVFRRAVSKAIDRDAMIRAVYFGHAVKNWSTSTGSDKVWHLPDVPHDDYNPSEAKQLLASLDMVDRDGDGIREDRGGHPLGFTIQTNSDSNLRVAMANFIRDDLLKVGIKVALAPLEFNTFSTHVRNDFRYDAAILSLGFGRPDPAMALSLWRSSSASHLWHVSQAKPQTPQEAQIDELADRITATIDPPTRKNLWYELHRIANEQAWLIWLPVLDLKLPISNRFANVRPTGALSGASSILWNAEQFHVKVP